MGNYYHKVKMGTGRGGVLELDVTLFKEAAPVVEEKTINGIKYAYAKKNDIPERKVFVLKMDLDQKFVNALHKFGIGDRELLDVYHGEVSTMDYERLLEREGCEEINILSHDEETGMYEVEYAQYSINKNALYARVREIYEMVYKDHEVHLVNGKVYIYKALDYKLLLSDSNQNISLSGVRLQFNAKTDMYEVSEEGCWKGRDIIGVVYGGVDIENLTDGDVEFCGYKEMMSKYRASAYIASRDNVDLGAMLK